MNANLRLTERLRSATSAVHRELERGPFVSTMLRGALGRAAYVDLLRNLEPIYAALETALDRHAGEPALRTIDFTPLARTSRLREDIAALEPQLPTDARSLPGSQPQEPSRVYVRRLQDVAEAQPELLLAHAYVRYLGDLSGGQLLRRIVAVGLGSAPGVGVAFYDFGDADATAMLARRFRSGLDEAKVGDPDGVVAEALLGFELHRRLFEALAARHDLDRSAPASEAPRRPITNRS